MNAQSHRQWDVDAVRSAGILGRGAPAVVREALLAQGIAKAPDIPDGTLADAHAVVAAAPEGAALVASLADPVLPALGDGFARWVRAVAGEEVAVGQSAPAPLDSLDQAARQAAVALRVARSRPPGAEGATWAELGADRLGAQLPRLALRDLPDPLRHLISAEPSLTETLATFLDAGGDIQATAALLSLHRPASTLTTATIACSRTSRSAPSD